METLDSIYNCSMQKDWDDEALIHSQIVFLDKVVAYVLSKVCLHGSPFAFQFCDLSSNHVTNGYHLRFSFEVGLSRFEAEKFRHVLVFLENLALTSNDSPCQSGILCWRKNFPCKRRSICNHSVVYTSLDPCVNASKFTSISELFPRVISGYRERILLSFF